MQHIQKPEDLDLFTPDQVEVSRAMSNLPADKAVEALTGTALKVGIEILHHINTTFPLAMWQRAAYEIDARAKRTGNLVDKSVSRMIFHWVRFLQEVDEGNRTDRANPELRKTAEGIAGQYGIDIPSEEEE